ncbi:unnamed protein product [Linum trigynum]|uniref:Uncharacterized protein n=1 Tax=Linum trigynum TaxID=586398 RepID=A0AAV2F728_9ROSI
MVAATEFVNLPCFEDGDVNLSSFDDGDDWICQHRASMEIEIWVVNAFSPSPIQPCFLRAVLNEIGIGGYGW